MRNFLEIHIKKLHITAPSTFGNAPINIYRICPDTPTLNMNYCSFLHEAFNFGESYFMTAAKQASQDMPEEREHGTNLSQLYSSCVVIYYTILLSFCRCELERTECQDVMLQKRKQCIK